MQYRTLYRSIAALFLILFFCASNRSYAQRLHETHLDGIPLGIKKAELIKQLGQPDSAFTTPAKKEVLSFLLDAEGIDILFAEFLHNDPETVYGLQILGKKPLESPPLNGLNIGDPDTKVIKKYGKPDNIKTSANSKLKAFYYAGSNYTFEFYDNKIGGISIYYTEVVQYQYIVDNFIENEHLSEFDAYFKTALYLRNNKKYATALPFFSKALSLQPDNWEAMTAAGNNYRGLEQYGKAIDLYNNALKKKPGNPVLTFNLGITYGNQKNYPKALELLQKVEKMPAGSVSNQIRSSTYFNIGNIYNDVGRYREAIPYYRKSLEVDSARWLASVYKAYIHEQFRQYDTSLQDINTALKYNSDEPALQEAKQRLVYKMTINKNLSGNECRGDINNDGNDEVIRIVDDSRFAIYDPEGKLLYTSPTVGHVIGDSTRPNTVRKVLSGDLDGNGTDEIVLVIDPVYTMTPTILIYGTDKSGLLYRKLESLSPGLGINNKIDIRTNIYTLGEANHIPAKDNTPVELGLSAVEYYKKRSAGFSIVVFDNSIHSDSRNLSNCGPFFVNKTGYHYKNDDIKNIIEPSVTAIGIFPISGKGEKNLLFTAVEETVWIYDIESFHNNGLIDKHWWKGEMIGSLITGFSATEDGNVRLSTVNGVNYKITWENDNFLFKKE